MVAYTKPWLPVSGQVEKLASRGVDVGAHADAERLLRAAGYYRLTGYLYPHRESITEVDDEGNTRIRVLSEYVPGTSLDHAQKLLDFDRELRMLVMDGIERIEVSLRMQLGYVLGEVSTFAHEDPANFVPAFTEKHTDPETGELTSNHAEWLQRVRDRRDDSQESFVAHFREKYDGQMPIWALTEILELGHIGRLYGGLQNSHATAIAQAYNAPSKKVMSSWIASLNYVRNVAAHHARLFNRKLVRAPSRPKAGAVPLLDHLRDAASAKEVLGLYNALAVAAYLLRSIDSGCGWPERIVALMSTFPSTATLTVASTGAPDGFASLELWR
jgi:abortive infection bacteriophage resistance protein